MGNKNALKRIDWPDKIPTELLEQIDSKKKCLALLLYIIKAGMQGELSERIVSSLKGFFRLYMEGQGYITKSPLVVTGESRKEQIPIHAEQIIQATKDMSPELKVFFNDWIRKNK